MTSTVSRLALATTIAFAFNAQAAFASTEAEAEQTATSSSGSGATASDTETGAEADRNILVSAEGLKELDFISGQDVLNKEDIQRNLNGQIGEVLTKVPGVSATSFTPGASRPILRGLDGERVRVLTNGLGTADVGNTSGDHATTVDPLTVNRIEILRGPSALLFGSQSIGGVVNVIDGRIPTEAPEDGIEVSALTAFDTATDLRSGGASVDVGLTDSIVFHLDGSFRETGDVQIPGFQLSDDLRADLLGDADEEEEEGEFEEAEELREAADQEGFIPNSYTESWTVNGGLGIILGQSSFGASVGYFDTDYGLVGNPEGGHHHGEEEGEGGEEEEEEEGEEIVTIGLEQLRVDFSGDVFLGTGFFSRLKLRAGYSDYTHTEFEGPEVGTVYDSETFEARAELLQSAGGVIGLQYTSRDFGAVGEEAFVAPNDTTQIALFTVQEFDLGPVEIEAAGRYERVDVEAETLGIERDFDLLSGALSIVTGSDNVRAGVTASRSERAPAGEELFADGPHIATQQFEIGDVNLGVESAWGLEGFVRADAAGVSLGASVFYQSFDNFIFLAPTGEEEDELPVFVYLQEDARFFGFEADIVLPIVDQNGFALSTDLRASYVSGTLSDGAGDLPRIPPVTLLGALDADIDAFNVRGEVQWFAEQDNVAEFETTTDEFTLLNLYVSWAPLPDNQNVVLQLAGENLGNVTGRRHSSFTKDFVPLPGRNVRASVRVAF